MFGNRFVHLYARVAKPPSHNHHRPLSSFPFSRPTSFLLRFPKSVLISPSLSPSSSSLLPSPPRCFFINIPSPLQPPLIFTALLLALWFYKCVMLVLFQNRIIYMPSMPPFARSERIAEYAAVCRPVGWREDRIAAKDGAKLAVAVGEIAGAAVAAGREDGEREGKRKRKRVVIIYFQGNGSSLPPRLPALSSILKLLHQTPLTTHSTSSPNPSPPIYTILALSYRGYWTSTGRPSEPGLILDAEAILAHAARTYPPSPNTSFVLWGQSLGASVALTAAANATTSPPPSRGGPPPIHGLILETPFLSIRAMLLALYPQNWLPYHYLAPFLRNHWDAPTALRRLASVSSSSSISSNSTTTKITTKPKILLLHAARDELVPPHHALDLHRLCLELGWTSAKSDQGLSSGSEPGPEVHGSEFPGSRGEVHRISVSGAFHTDVLSKAAGRRAVADFLSSGWS